MSTLYTFRPPEHNNTAEHWEIVISRMSNKLRLWWLRNHNNNTIYFALNQTGSEREDRTGHMCVMCLLNLSLSLEYILVVGRWLYECGGIVQRVRPADLTILFGTAHLLTMAHAQCTPILATWGLYVISMWWPTSTSHHYQHACQVFVPHLTLLWFCWWKKWKSKHQCE